jgi:hypothetical protein
MRIRYTKPHQQPAGLVGMGTVFKWEDRVYMRVAYAGLGWDMVGAVILETGNVSAVPKTTHVQPLSGEFVVDSAHTDRVLKRNGPEVISLKAVCSPTGEHRGGVTEFGDSQTSVV